MIAYLFWSLAIAAVVAVPSSEDHADRSADHSHSGSAERYKEHHSVQYDHEAFLGEDQAKSFDQLPPEESKRRLGIIVERIDSDHDGFVSLVELKDWIKYTQKRYIDEDVDRHWKQHNPDDEQLLPWEKYYSTVYGFLEKLDETEKLNPNSEAFAYTNLLKRDKRRWHHADIDQNDALNRSEFGSFLHPEDHPDMRYIVVQETLEDIDRDNDGKISVEEYIGDMYKVEEGEEHAEEPDWVKQEREQFSSFRDANGDGYLDEHEVKDWIAPAEFDHAEAEARHLVYEADADSDERLTKEEILEKYDLFVGSQATDFGEALARHDEF